LRRLTGDTCFEQSNLHRSINADFKVLKVGGAYKSSSGDLANLETGAYTLVNGSTGNIYSDDEAAKPNILTLPMPSQFTASGVGSAIPASDLGDDITLTYTTTFPGTTIPASTMPPVTIAESVTSQTIFLASTISTEISNSWIVTTSAIETVSAATISGTTISGSTVPARTVGPLVATITVTEAVAPSSSTKNNGASAKLKAHSHAASLLVFLLGFFLQFGH
jgi:hypothetical protein